MREELLRHANGAAADLAGFTWSVVVDDRVPYARAPNQTPTLVYDSDHREWRLRVEARTELTATQAGASPTVGRLQVIYAGNERVRSHRERPDEVILAWPGRSFDDAIVRVDLLDQSLRFIDWRAAANIWERVAEFDIQKSPEADSRVRWALLPRDRPGQSFEVVFDVAGAPRIVEFSHWVNAAEQAGRWGVTAEVQLDGDRRPRVIVQKTLDRTGAALRTVTMTVKTCQRSSGVSSLVAAELTPIDGTSVFDPARRVAFVTGTPEIRIGERLYRLKEPLRIYRPDLLESILRGTSRPDTGAEQDSAPAPARNEESVQP